MSRRKGRTGSASPGTRSRAPSGSPVARWTTAQKSIVVATGLAFSLGVIAHQSPVNGFEQFTDWVWTWRDLGIARTGALLAAPFALIAGVLWSTERDQPPVPLVIALGTLALANCLLQILGMLADPRGIDLVRQIVTSPGATSYFTDALLIHPPLHDWLAHFPAARLALHSATHPAGPILLYYPFITFLGPSTGALAGGCAVGVMASAGVPVMYAFAGLWTAEPKVRLTASAWYALLPALSLFFPELDQVYPILSMLLILSWVGALRVDPGSYRFAVAAGAVLFIATFLAYNLLAIGAFLAFYSLYWLWRNHRSRAAVAAFARALGVTLVVCALLYAGLWRLGSYNPVASFRQAMVNQGILANEMGRRYLPFALLDPYDFVLGAGAIVLPILFFHLRRLRARWDAEQIATALTLIGLASILTVDLSGLLRGETARVWLFLQPLVIVPVAIELAALSRPWRVSIFALQWWILVCLKANMTFVNP